MWRAAVTGAFVDWAGVMVRFPAARALTTICPNCYASPTSGATATVVYPLDMTERECPNCGELMGRGPICAACARVYVVAVVTVVALIVALVWLAVAWRHGELAIRFS